MCMGSSYIHSSGSKTCAKYRNHMDNFFHQYVGWRYYVCIVCSQQFQHLAKLLVQSINMTLYDIEVFGNKLEEAHDLENTQLIKHCDIHPQPPQITQYSTQLPQPAVNKDNDPWNVLLERYSVKEKQSPC